MDRRTAHRTRRLVQVLAASVTMLATSSLLALPAFAYTQVGTVYFGSSNDLCGGGGSCTSIVDVAAWVNGAGIGTPQPISLVMKTQNANANWVFNADSSVISGTWYVEFTVTVNGTSATNNNWRATWVAS